MIISDILLQRGAEVREQILAAIRRVAKQESLAAGFPESLAPSVTLRKEHTPAAYNDPQLTQELFSVFETALGEGSVLTTGPVMGGEDFGRFPTASGNPGCIFWLGGAPARQFAEAHARQERLPDIHHDHFAPDPEPTLRTGVQAMVAGVLHLLPVE